MGNAQRINYREMIPQYFGVVNYKALYIVLAANAENQQIPFYFFSVTPATKGGQGFCTLKKAVRLVRTVHTLLWGDTGAADSVDWRACRRSAAQRRPGNTRSKSGAQEMTRSSFGLEHSILLSFLR